MKLEICGASHDAVSYACKHWHYSKTVPSGKLYKLQVNEDGAFVGVVVFGRGSTPNIGSMYGLEQDCVCELVRVAMRKHKTQVSRIMSICVNMLKKSNPGIRLIVSFADPAQGHHGGIYQACGWVYTGQSSPKKFFVVDGKMTHPRSIGAMGLVQNINDVRKHLDSNASIVHVPGKHRYVLPLDEKMTEVVEKMRKPYPKRPASIDGDVPTIQVGEGGSSPTAGLQEKS